MEPIAIVGSSCRLPGSASTPSKLWSLLKEPRDIQREIPIERFNPHGFYNENGEYHGSANVKHSYFLDEDHRVFDNSFFQISPKEAESMDPQQRILLETVFEGIDAGGFSIQDLKGTSVAVFVGQMNNDYYNVLIRDVDSAPQYFATGATLSIMSNRVSYFFDWRGPSATIDTACSSSMVALHMAVQALRNGEATMSVAAGVNLILGPEMYIFESKLHMLSPTGRSRMWDADVDGYARGEGFAAVVLKPLSQAIADNDHIDCIIRETGVNQDGRTKGITMPNSAAQAALIRSVYARCGLDLAKTEDRPQYFEAHGTGTPAGDPIEAEAIHTAFFPGGENPSQSKLYVGSIKTIVGHLEGAAGLAGLLKASLAMKNSTIPPNMLFNRLNPKIEPFYDNLCVPTQAMAWPHLSKGIKKRASVNSFGFGGTNAHAIIEAWDPLNEPRTSEPTLHYGPFNVSGHSTQALTNNLAVLANTVRNSENINIADLGYTLSRRSQLTHRTSFSAVSREELASKLEDAALKASSIATRGTAVTERFPLRILGVFTGQGAQWPEMGADLYRTSMGFRRTIQHLEASLASLPDPPTWLLSEQLLAPKTTSRVGEAFVSQPLCTALQIALVDMLRQSGLTFSAVVGHSSGEIGAAYAAGHVTGWDAIRIAYYRGIYAPLAKGSDGQLGKMMAVGMSLDEATAFCSRESFAGRIAIAAANARSSVTLSGDADAIDEAFALLTELNIFARLLKVDTAYHSHHMKRCAVAYLESLRVCKFQIRNEPPSCTWYSSVYGANGRSVGIDKEALQGQYWVDNMVQTVLFSQAVHRAVTEEHFHDMILEIGPHPALKGPASETLKALIGWNLPYSGTLKRGENDFNAFCDALGFVWRHFISPKSLLNLDKLRESCAPETNSNRPRVLEDTPSYNWDHEKVLWKESKKSRAFRTRTEPVHELLGTCTTNGQNDEMTWRNIMRVSELDYLRGHIFQGQILFPAGGYVAMAYEAAVRLAGNYQVSLVELHELRIQKAITLNAESAGTEVTLVIRCTDRNAARIEAEYSCFSGDVDATGQMTEHANFHGKATLILGAPVPDALPARVEPKLPMELVDLKRLYSHISQIGLDYSGLFVTDSVKRRLNMATVTAKRLDHSPLRVHPATLDACFHSIFAAFSWPGDGRLWTSYLPTSIASVRVNMTCPESHSYSDKAIVADCHLTEGSSKIIAGDIDVFCAEHGQAQIQVRTLTCSSFTKSLPADDKRLYAQNVWKRDLASGLESTAAARIIAMPDHSKMAELFERAAYFYLRRLREQVSWEEVAPDWQMQHLMHWVLDYLLPQIERDEHPRVKSEWAADTEDVILKEMATFPEQIECELMKAVGDNIAAIIKGDAVALQVLFHNDMLGKLYTDGLGFKQANIDLAATVSQLTHRYPGMNILEIGAGTGGATRSILKTIGKRQLRSYTYTDISAGFFEKATDVFFEYLEKMTFKVLNIESDPVVQGFEGHSYDLIIASNVLHATKTLEETMKNCRRLLKPGGYLMLLEITSDALRPQFIVSSLPGWFLGIEDGRIWAPTINEGQWDNLLKKTGFSGIDTTARDSYNDADYCFSVITSQAVDERVATLRNPLQFSSITPKIPKLVVIGGGASRKSGIAARSAELLEPITDDTMFIDSLDHIDRHGLVLPSDASIICLTDLNTPVFADMTRERFAGLQKLFSTAKHLLWVTRGARSDNPYANMVIGLGRSLLLESKNIRLQFIDLLSGDRPNPVMLAEALIRLACSDLEEFKEVLWSTEHELAIDHDGFYIPRLLPNEEMNHRLNSDRRQVIEEIPIDDHIVNVSQVHDEFVLVKASHEHSSPALSPIQIRTRASSAYPFTTSDDQKIYLIMGSVVETGRQIIAMSSLNSSFLSVSKDQTFDLEDGEGTNSKFHQLLVSLIAESTIDGIEGRLWIHEPDEDLVDSVIEFARRDRTDLFITTSAPTSDERLTFLHRYISKQDLAALVPSDVGTFINMDTSVDGMLEKNFPSLPKPSLRNRRLFTDTESEKSAALSFDMSNLRRFMKRYDWKATSTINTRYISLEQLSHASGNVGATSVIDWSCSQTVPLQVRPLNHFGLFSANKTYLMVGLTGDLGLSLCDWMIQHGAKHVVLTSRNPKINSETLKYLRRKGTVDVRIVAVDASDKSAMTKFIKEIRGTMPPVGGVANAAMVLRDKAFQNMTWEDFQAVLAPKVQGSQILDEIFSDTALEFFIMFSSLACIVGNSGQSNYGAANMFMTSLAYQRRARGLPASVIHIAMLLGVGYVTRAIDQYESTLLSKYKYMAISETDFRNIFAEAIVTGRPVSSGREVVEIVTGLNQDSEAPWRENPRFSHYQQEQGATDNVWTKQSTAAADVRSQLAEAQSDEDTLHIIENGLLKKLELVLQISSDKIDKEASLIDLGIDSLVAVDIRSWFLKELNFDMPVLKILGDTHVTALCKEVIGSMRGETATQVVDETDRAPAALPLRVDWEAEIASLCAGLPSAANKGTSRRSSDKLSVVITGATGFLGKHIVRRLIEQESVGEIHCIAIRRDAQGNARRTGFDSAKIHEHAGDLGEALLGLSEAEFERLSQTADTIIHNGADVSFLKSYQAMQSTNVLSTKALVTMACPRAVPIHFISTAAVALFAPEKELPEISAAHLNVPETGDRGYALSKWVNEVFLERISALRQVPSVIHRAVNIVGEGAPETDLMTALDTYTKALGAVPDLRGNALDGNLDVVEVSEVADSIVATVLSDSSTFLKSRDLSNSNVLPVVATHESSLKEDLSVPRSRPPPTPLSGPSASLGLSQLSVLSSHSSSPSLRSSSTVRRSSPATAPSSTSSSYDSLDDVNDKLDKEGSIESDAKQEIFKIINYCSDVKIGPAEVRSYMEGRLGKSLDELPFQTWLEKSHDLGMNRLVNFFLQDSLRQGKPIASPCLRKGRV
ncbi:MAG: Type I Iterative PKS [Bogoriella megaspora]|nr:MAG: Type I Iterative PKS [Bogoriella megaspora]